MRYSRMREHVPEEPKSGGAGGVILVLVILGILVYLFCTAKAGSFLADKIIIPVTEFFSQKAETASLQKTETENTDNAAELPEERVTFRELSLYALQTGIYEERGTAEDAAEEQKKVGGAGYLHEDAEGKFRLMISAYHSKEDAENVRDRLQKEQELESNILELNAPQLEYTLQSDEDAIGFFRRIAEEAPEYYRKLMELSLSLDKGEKTADSVRSELSAMLDQCAADLERIGGYAQKSEDAFLKKILRYYSSVENELRSAADVESNIDLSAALKHAYLGCAYAYAELIRIND